MVLDREPKWSKKVPQKSHKIDKNYEKWCLRPPSGQDPEKVAKKPSKISGNKIKNEDSLTVLY